MCFIETIFKCRLLDIAVRDVDGVRDDLCEYVVVS
jgi:hypothetical protein